MAPSRVIRKDLNQFLFVILRFGIGYLVVFTAMVGMCSALTTFCSAFAWPYFGRRRRSVSGHWSSVLPFLCTGTGHPSLTDQWFHSCVQAPVIPHWLTDQCFHSCVQALVIPHWLTGHRVWCTPVYSHQSSLIDWLATGYGVLLCAVTGHPLLCTLGMCTVMSVCAHA